MTRYLNLVKSTKLFTALFVLSFVAKSTAWAVATPTDTAAFLYPVFDLIYNKIGGGPVMFSIGFIGICVAGYFMFHSQYGKTVSALVATGIIVGAGAIVPTLGAII